jgi:hypothetical protein
VEIRCHQGPRLGDKLDEAAKLELMILDRFKDIFDADSRLKSRYLQKIGGKLIRVGNSEMGRWYIIQAIKTCPSNLISYGQYILGFTSPRIYNRIHRFYLKSNAVVP